VVVTGNLPDFTGIHYRLHHHGTQVQLLNLQETGDQGLSLKNVLPFCPSGYSLSS
jgi:hypothetical protein